MFFLNLRLLLAALAGSLGRFYCSTWHIKVLNHGAQAAYELVRYQQYVICWYAVEFGSHRLQVIFSFHRQPFFNFQHEENVAIRRRQLDDFTSRGRFQLQNSTNRFNEVSWDQRNTVFSRTGYDLKEMIGGWQGREVWLKICCNIYLDTNKFGTTFEYFNTSIIHKSILLVNVMLRWGIIYLTTVKDLLSHQKKVEVGGWFRVIPFHNRVNRNTTCFFSKIPCSEAGKEARHLRRGLDPNKNNKRARGCGDVVGMAKHPCDLRIGFWFLFSIPKQKSLVAKKWVEQGWAIHQRVFEFEFKNDSGNQATPLLFGRNFASRAQGWTRPWWLKPGLVWWLFGRKACLWVCGLTLLPIEVMRWKNVPEEA